MRYFLIIDADYAGMVVRSDGTIQERFDLVSRKWIRTGILLQYQWPDSEKYGLLEEITEEKAHKMIA